MEQFKNINFMFDDNDQLESVSITYPTSTTPLEISLAGIEALYDYFETVEPERDLGEDVVDFVSILASMQLKEIQTIIETIENEPSSDLPITLE